MISNSRTMPKGSNVVVKKNPSNFMFFIRVFPPQIKNTSVFSSLWMFMVNTKITYHTKLGVVSNINFLPARHLSMINVSAPRMMLKAILACMDMI